MLKVLNCVTQDHDLWLVALSALICGLGCFTTVTLLSRRTQAHGSAWWPLAAAVIFGCSIWALHFVAMLAFMPDLKMGYDLAITVASCAIPICGAGAAFFLFQSHGRRSIRVSVGGLLLGGAISGMHYTGVAAMRFSGFALFDDVAITVSVLISIAFSAVALARSNDLSRLRRRLETAAWLAIGICGLHFTGMSAITIAPGDPVASGHIVLGTTTLAIVVGSVSLVILAASLAAVLMEQHLAQRTVQELARMRLLSNLSHEALLIHSNGVVIEVNSAGERLFKHTAAGLVGLPLLQLFAETSVPAICRRMQSRAEELRPEEVEILTAEGTPVAVELSCQAITYMGRPATALAFRDLTDRKRDEAHIRHLARHDALTNLPNRTMLQERLELALDTAAHDGSGVAVLYLDLDRFKPVNDMFGHAVGDELLRRATKRMQAKLGNGDLLARIGGDEFVIVSAGVTAPDKVATLARRLIDTLRQPFAIEGHRVEIGVSAGIALYPEDGGTPDDLLRAADTAMYRVKDEGRGALRFFEPAMNAQLQARRLLEQELAGAVAAGQFVLYYQPIVNAATGEVETFEALIRWNHPVRGLVPPMEFIPFAEETNLIAAIGAWVIDTACATAAAWPQPWRVSVNVSPSQFRYGEVCATVAAALSRHDLQPNRLVIEITESVLMEDTAKALGTLNRLRDLGVRIALDDFGTGFSSLSYLQLFRFDKFKIDKSFVKRLGQSADALTITRTIVNLGHNLGLQVTAEGVETPQQLALLKSFGCDQIQGYLVARPAPEGSFSDRDHVRTRLLFQPEPLRLSA